LRTPFLVVGRYANLHEINLGASGNTAEGQDKNRPVALRPMRCPPELHNLFSANQVKILALELSAKRGELAAYLSANPRAGAPVERLRSLNPYTDQRELEA
jgi:hypothetical protein